MTRREFAERFLTLADDLEWDSMPVGEVIAAIHEVEDGLASGETEGYVEWLEDEIEEYEGNDGMFRRHVDEAKELLTALKEGDIHD